MSTITGASRVGEAREGETSLRAFEEEDADEVDPGVVADLFYGLYGERALEILKRLATPEPTGEAQDSGGHEHDEAGRFTAKAHGASHTAHAVSQSVAGFKSGEEDSTVYERPAAEARRNAKEARKAARVGNSRLAAEYHKDASASHDEAREGHAGYSGPGHPTGHLHREAERAHHKAAAWHKKAEAAHRTKATPEPTGEAWDEASHPRGKGGKFIQKGSAEAVGAAKAAVNRVLAGDASADPKEIIDHLSILTVAQINELARAHGKTAPKLLRAQLVDAVVQIMGQNKGAEPTAKPAPAAAAAGDPVEQIMQAYQSAPVGQMAGARNKAIKILDGLPPDERKRALTALRLSEDPDDPRGKYGGLDDAVATAIFSKPAPAAKHKGGAR